MYRDQASPTIAPTLSAINDYEYPALCIPRALGNITYDELYNIIRQSGLGDISKIVMKPKEFILPKWERTIQHQHQPQHQPQPQYQPQQSSDNTVHDIQTVCYNNIYIYFKKWNTDNPRVRKYRDNILNGKSIKIVHNTIPSPIFWRCVAANFTSLKPK